MYSFSDVTFMKNKAKNKGLSWDKLTITTGSLFRSEPYFCLFMKKTEQQFFLLVIPVETPSS